MDGSTEQLVQAFRALGDPTRLSILRLLLDGERCVCELTDRLAAAQSRLSFHLKSLRDAGLVVDRREGRWIYYAIVPEAFEPLMATLENLTGATHTPPDIRLQC
jgi:ArsR family transcriptional regulator, arsenate/arsenite/antimonite-responsive transcriptional repressor